MEAKPPAIVYGMNEIVGLIDNFGGVRCDDHDVGEACQAFRNGCLRSGMECSLRLVNDQNRLGIAVGSRHVCLVAGFVQCTLDCEVGVSLMSASELIDWNRWSIDIDCGRPFDCGFAFEPDGGIGNRKVE